LETINQQANITADWPGRLPSFAEGLLYHKGLIDDSPMASYLNNYFANFTQVEKKLVVSAVDVETGLYKTFTEAVGLGNLATVIRASASIPFIFEPTPFNGSLYMDGGTTWNINLKDAVDRCLELVDDEAHVVLDVAITEAVHIPLWNETGCSATNFWRKHQIQRYYGKMNDVIEFAKARPHVNYRHFFQPAESLGHAWDEMKFDNATTWTFQQTGRDDAKQAINSANDPTESIPLHTFERVLTNHLTNN